MTFLIRWIQERHYTLHSSYTLLVNFLSCWLEESHYTLHSPYSTLLNCLSYWTGESHYTTLLLPLLSCWIEESHYTLILSAPVCVSMLVNLVFLINIVRVLVTKLRANHVAPDTRGTRKAVRATLILIPLLGLHYVLMPLR